MRKLSEIKELLSQKGIVVKEENMDGIFAVDQKRKRTIQASWAAGWEHVSICDWNGIDPSWTEMCELKDLFWSDEEAVIQIHPPKSEYVNNLEHCLHLWKPIEKYTGPLPLPDSILVGIKGMKFNDR